MPRLGRGNPYVPKTGLGGYLGYYPDGKGLTPENGPKRSGPWDNYGLVRATRRPASAITKAAASATAAVTSQATVYPLMA